MHSVIKDDNLFQSVLGFPNLNPNSDVAACVLIRMFPVYLTFHNDLLVTNLRFQIYKLLEPD